jgi:hypothetical protein
MQNLEERNGKLRWRINLDAIAANMDALLGLNVSALEYDGRALFISGARSDYIGHTYHGQIYQLFPQAEFSVIGDAGRYPHVEQPEQFASRKPAFSKARTPERSGCAGWPEGGKRKIGSAPNSALPACTVTIIVLFLSRKA